MAQKEKVWMFGDSYGDIDCLWDPNSFSWVGELHKLYDVTNFCIKGTGADYTISNFIDKVDKNDNLKDTNLIFIIPSVYRLNFSFFKKVSDQVLTTYILNDDNDVRVDSIDRRIKLYRKEYWNFISKFFEYYLYPNYANDTTLKIIGSISLYSLSFKSVLCYVVNEKPAANINNLINNNNFYFVDKKLIDVSIAGTVPERIGEDRRNNHLNEHNNKVMFEQITKWISDRKPPDITKFDS